ncbi:MAG: hypothetical protein DI551_05880 [Micavibrio aeruginosavorus]|uniref:Uncharacterized protein n=1 Tax=Micavibrio aeruginosavorus TaxID=349221 RepID=A0A2W5N5N9_9BACT|nr:MAG: hypothetical protein DI551_05880 [Micavibrio aeruginosavorus]
MEEIEKRLRESTDACIKNFEVWIKNGKSLESRETLMETMHEVRKVLARVEIEIAISERDRMGARPIPIPPHRSQRKRNEEGDAIDGDDFDDSGEGQPPQQAGGSGEGRRQQHSGRNRRPMHRSGSGNNGNNNNGNNGNTSAES